MYGQKKVLFFWGYRTHVIVSKEGIPLVEITLLNNKTDAKVAQKLTKKLKLLNKAPPCKSHDIPAYLYKQKNPDTI